MERLGVDVSALEVTTVVVAPIAGLVDTMTSISGDTIAAFVGPVLGVKNGRSLNKVVAGARFHH